MKSLIIDNNITNYQIDETGKIYNIKTKKYLKGTVRSGYLMVKLTVDKKKKDYSVHRLVAQTFLDNPNNLPQVNHKDRDKLNNSVENLEWVSNSENILHSWNTGKSPRQPIKKIKGDIDFNNWRQYKNTFYWINSEGMCINYKNKNILNKVKTNDGYYKYQLYIDGKNKSFLIHKLVFLCFNGDYDESIYQINHKDGDKNNNSLSNLELATRSDNMRHSYNVLRHNIKIVEQYTLEGKLLNTYDSLSSAAKLLNYNISGISQACNGKINTYKGYIWKYKV